MHDVMRGGDSPSARRAMHGWLRARRIAAAVAGWAIAALLVGMVGPWVAARDGAGAALLFNVAAVLAVSGLLAIPALRVRRLGPTAWVGAGWLALSIVAEICVAGWGRPRWSDLLGSTAAPWMHNVLMLSWLVGPALFSRAATDD